MQIPINALSPQALVALVEEYVTRDGTDYGVQELTLQDKRDAALAQLRSGDAVVVFDAETETANIVSKEELRRGDGR